MLEEHRALLLAAAMITDRKRRVLLLLGRIYGRQQYLMHTSLGSAVIIAVGCGATPAILTVNAMNRADARVFVK